jgi:kynureninase
MAPGFQAENGAEGWNVSTAPIMLMALHKASLDIFEKAGGLKALRAKSETLTGYLEYKINDINAKIWPRCLPDYHPKKKASAAASYR